MRKIRKLLTVPLVRYDPRISRHIRNGVIAGHEGAIGEAFVEDAVKSIGLLYVSFNRVRDLFRRVCAEMRVLPRHRTQPAHLPKQPLDDLIAAAQIAWQKLAGFFSEIEHNCPGLEHGY